MKPLPKMKRKGDRPNKPVAVLPHPASGDTVQASGSGDASMDQASVRQRSHKPLLIGASVAALLIVGGVVYVSGGLNPSATVSEARMTIGTVALRPFEESVPVNALLVPERTVYLDTVEGGRVTVRHQEDGTFVAAGTPLITLRNKSLELDVMNREAQYTQQLSSLAQAQIAFDQNMLRYDQDLMNAELEINLTRADLDRRLPRDVTGVPQSEIDRLQAELSHRERSYAVISAAKERDTANAARNLDQLKQSVARMEASIELVRESLEGLTLRAPIDGEVSALTTEVGEVLAPGARVAQIDETGAFKVRAQINEFYLGRLGTGQSAQTEIGGEAFELSVEKIYPTVENREFAADLRFAAATPDGLRRGQSLQLRISLGDRAEYLTIPTGAFYEETGGQFVYVLNPASDTATKRDVVLGRRGNDQIQVISGLSAGEDVITSSYSTFSGRDRVRIKQPSRS
ncbi:MAG: efflux RND transporter periplasmic adaptor subunit [Henriciella sp.]